MDEAVELDEALGSERIVLASCSHAVDANDVVAKAHRALADTGADPDRVDRPAAGTCGRALIEFAEPGRDVVQPWHAGVLAAPIAEMAGCTSTCRGLSSGSAAVASAGALGTIWRRSPG